MKQVAIEPTLLNQSNNAYTNPMFTVMRVKVPRYQFVPKPELVTLRTGSARRSLSQ